MAVVVVDAVVAVAVDAVVAVEDMSGSPPGTSLKHCKLVAKEATKFFGDIVDCDIRRKKQGLPLTFG